MAKQRKETINHPNHYGGDTTYEVIKVIDAWGFNTSFCLGNALKYIARCNKKNNKKEDLQKAIWYINKEIENEK